MTDRVRLRDLVRGAIRLVPRTPQLLDAMRLGFKSNPREPTSIGSILEDAAVRHGERPALRFDDRVVSYARLNEEANRAAHALRRRGVHRGEVVAVMMDNAPEVLFVVAGLCKLGALAALINTHQRGQVLAHSLEVAGVRWAVADAAHRPALAEVWNANADRLLAIDGLTGDTPRWNPASTGAIRIGDPCFYVYTSGTTGLPKASVMTHLRWVKAGAAFGKALAGLTPGDVVYVATPFYHTLAITMAWSAATLCGASLAIGRRFSASGFWDDCRRHGATVMAYIGEVPRYLLAQPPSPADRDHDVRKAVGVGLRPDLWEPFRERFGIERICEAYGASEGNTLFFNLLGIDGTIGWSPTPHALVRFDTTRGEPIRDERGHLVKARRGEVGLLIGKITPTYPFDGYTDPETTAQKVFRDPFGRGDDWFDTGDLLKDVGFGHAVFVDRVGDTFRWKSENVATGEVEAALAAHPSVAECAVYGVEVPGHEGRAGMAALVLGEGAGVDDLAVHLLEGLPAYAVPVFIRQVGSLETTGTFKHKKATLRDEGFDPTTIDDPLWVRSGRRYVPLTATVHAEVLGGRRRL